MGNTRSGNRNRQRLYSVRLSMWVSVEQAKLIRAYGKAKNAPLSELLRAIVLESITRRGRGATENSTIENVDREGETG